MDNEQNYVDVPLEISKITGDKWGELFLTQLTGKKELLPVELFEESLNLTDKQLIALYNYWGNTRVILIKNTAIALEISKISAESIMELAFKFGLITQWHNSTWRFTNRVDQERWRTMASQLERGERPLNYAMPSTPEESIARLESRVTPNQRAIARGEGERGVIVKDKKVKENNIEESPVQVIHKTTKIKEEERQKWEKEQKEGAEKARTAMNDKTEQSTHNMTLPPCVTRLPRPGKK